MTFLTVHIVIKKEFHISNSCALCAAFYSLNCIHIHDQWSDMTTGRI